MTSSPKPCKTKPCAVTKSASDAVYELLQDYRQLENLLNSQTEWFNDESEYRFTQGSLPELFAPIWPSVWPKAGKLQRLLDKQQSALTEAIKQGDTPRRDGEALSLNWAMS